MHHQRSTCPDFLTMKAAQHRYGVSRSTLYGWIAKGLLPKPVKLGPRAVRFRAADLATFEAQFAAARSPASDDAKASS